MSHVFGTLRSAVLISALLSACGGETSESTTPAQARAWDQIQASGELRVATRNAPTTWYLNRFGDPAGPEYDLFAKFAAHQQLALKIVEAETPAAVLQLVASGKADLAAAGLTVTPQRQQRFAFSTPTQRVTEQVICNREGQRAADLAALAQRKVAVGEGSSYVDSLRAQLPELRFKQQDQSTEAILRQVWKGKLDCTVADSHIALLNMRYFPTLVAEFDLGEPRELAWAVAPAAQELLAELNRWLASKATQRQLAQNRQRYLMAAENFDFVDLRAFARRIQERYPRYDQWFEGAAEAHDVDSVLLAAQAYQESHWDPKAKSPTGVRGMMMLTKPTAQALGVDDRLDPEQSIDGGGAYLAKMKGRFSDEVSEPDRTLLALAAYNIGRAHMHDAQKLARERGLSPYKWDDIRTVLPLLSDKKVYSKLKYGYARGHEPVRYVERIQEYQDVLGRHLLE